MLAEMIQNLNELDDIGQHYPDLTGDTRKELHELLNAIRDFKAYVPFIGIFTVGKSSLLNTWLGENLLPEAQGATTALPTELIPGPTMSMVIVSENGSEKVLANLPSNEDEANAPEAIQGLYAYCTSPSPNLCAIAPIIPVDMPGINSGIKRHTEAIYRYANKGSAFFLVFMPEEGTLPAAMKAFLQELQLNGRPVWMIMNKCDTASEENIESVIKQIQSQLQAIGVEPKGILRCSRASKQSAEELQKAFLSLNVNELNIHTHQMQAIRTALRLKDQIATLQESEQLDTAELDKQIKICERAEHDLQETLLIEKKKLNHKLEDLPDFVGSEVFNALENNVETLTIALERGEEVFATKITGIINNVVRASVDARIEQDFRDISQSIALALEKDSGDVFDPEKITKGLNLATQGLSQLAKVLATIKSGANLYKVVTTALAVTTSVIAPIVELIIIFLPDIINLFIDKEKARRDRINTELKRRVFPEIQQSIILQIKQQLPEIEYNLMEALNIEWTSRLEDAKNALEEAKNNKEDAKNNYEENQKAYEKDLDSINSIVQNFRNASAVKGAN